MITEIVNYLGTNFIVAYVTISGLGFVPATMNGKFHASAECNIYRITETNQVQIGTNIPTTYVEGGCFDADPKQAIEFCLKNPTYLNPSHRYVHLVNITNMIIEYPFNTNTYAQIYTNFYKTNYSFIITNSYN